MTKGTQTILKQALHLKPVERAELIERLLDSFDRAGDNRVDLLWAKEAESRIDAFDEGKMTADREEAVFDRINRR
ncbi:addiction module protein [Candidatus Sumerlaeota bacterium]|nr:addiction module protein [Candidatus Sumerlaeota bacterium]